MAQPLVLLHGALGAGGQLQPLAKLLSVKTEVAIYEFPGHGKRASENIDFSIDKLAADFHHWLDEKYDQPVKIFGYSMGGYVALYLASHHPDLFTKIITLGTKFKWSAAEAEKETAKLDPGFLMEKAPAYCDYLVQLHGNGHWKNVLVQTAALMKNLGHAPLLDETALQKIQTPVHLMLGELDKMVTREETETVKILLPHANFQLINGFVHPLERLDPQALATILEDL